MSMRKFVKAGAISAAALVIGAGSPAVAGPWIVGQWYQFGDRYYSVQMIAGQNGDTTGWNQALAQAQALAGPGGNAVTLASVTSADIDAFIFAGVDSATYWTIDGAGNNEGPFIGGYRSAGNWAWIDGDAWNYTQWNPGEPNNSGGVENYLQFFGNGSSRTGNWNDGSGVGAYGQAGLPLYYIAETAAPAGAVPEPATWALMIAGFGLVGAAMRRRPVQARLA